MPRLQLASAAALMESHVSQLINALRSRHIKFRCVDGRGAKARAARRQIIDPSGGRVSAIAPPPLTGGLLLSLQYHPDRGTSVSYRKSDDAL